MPTSLRIRPLLAALAAAAAPLAAADRFGISGEPESAVGIWAESQLDSEFTLGDLRTDWDGSQRLELGFRAMVAESDLGRGFIHAGLFYEDREWEEDAAKVDYEAFGLAVGGGIELRIIGRSGGALGLGVVPWARIGLATQHVIADDVLDEDLDELLNGNFNTGRFDGAVGIDLRLTLGRRVIIELGAGAEYWHSAHVTLVSTPSGGGAAIATSVNFYGHGTFARLGAAIAF